MSQPYLALEAQLHDAFWEAEPVAAEVALLGDFLRQHPGVALEVGAGSGRVMSGLIQRGFAVEGLELSPDMLALGQVRAARLGLDLVIHAGDMTTWRAARPYAAILAPAFTLQLADDPEATLRHWASLLEPQGGLYLSVFVPVAELLGELPEDRWYVADTVTLPDGRAGQMETRHRLDRQQRILHREHRYRLTGPGGAVATHHSRQTVRWFEHAQLVFFLKAAGFRLDRVLVDFDPSWPVGTGDPGEHACIRTYLATKIR